MYITSVPGMGQKNRCSYNLIPVGLTPSSKVNTLATLTLKCWHRDMLLLILQKYSRRVSTTYWGGMKNRTDGNLQHSFRKIKACRLPPQTRTLYLKVSQSSN